MVQELFFYQVEVQEASKEVAEREEEVNEERDGPEEGGKDTENAAEGVSVFCGGFAESLPEHGMATERQAYEKVTRVESR